MLKKIFILSVTLLVASPTHTVQQAELERAIAQLDAKTVERIIDQQQNAFSQNDFQQYANILRNTKTYAGNTQGIAIIDELNYALLPYLGGLAAVMWLVTREWKNYKPTLKQSKKMDPFTAGVCYLIYGLFGISAFGHIGSQLFLNYAHNRFDQKQIINDLLQSKAPVNH